MKPRWSSIPRSCGFLLLVYEDEANVSSAVEPPSPISHAVDIANM
jgi:hypothetical protein